MIVVDASAVGTFLIPDEDGTFARFAKESCRREDLYVPAHWSVEIASLLRKAKWRGRLTDEQAKAAAGVADGIALNLTVATAPPVTAVLMDSIAPGLSAYDCAYFLLARTLNCPILTDDGALRRVALAQDLAVLMP